MSKEILLIYQDCALCGDKKEWGAAQLALASKASQPVRKVSFVAEEAQGLPAKAVKAGITSMPFFTDGVHFAKSVEELLGLQKAEAKPKKSTKKKIKKEEADGDVAKS